MNKSHLRGAVCACLVVASFNASSALLSRAGGAAYYDTDSNLTWLMDANLAYTSSFGMSVINDISQFGSTGSGAPVNTDTGDITGLFIFRDVAGFTDYGGVMSYDSANEFITLMNADGSLGYLGTNTWRLPSALDSNGTGPCLGPSCTDSEFGGLYYNALGGSESNPVTDFSPFSFLGNAIFPQTGGTEFWTSTPYTGPDTGFTGDQWTFDIGLVACEPACQLNDTFTDNNADNLRLVWAVSTGDVLASTVPVPAALWLFGSGLLGLIGVARRKKA